VLLLQVVVLKPFDLRVLDEGERGAHLLVVADNQDLFAAQQGREFLDIRLRGFVHDDEVEGPNLARQLFGDAPGRHDPARNCAIAL
jgi:hypothetical protein